MSFRELIGSSVIVAKSGGKKQAIVFSYNDFLFFKIGEWFYRMNADGTSTHDKYRWEDLKLDNDETTKDVLGRLKLKA